MKRTVLPAALFIVIMMLTACGGKDNTVTQNEASGQQASNVTQDKAAMVETPNLTGAEVTTRIGTQDGFEEETATAGTSDGLTSPSAGEDRPVDLDLTRISGTVVYSQVYDMMTNPDNYLGQMIRMKGSFSYYQDPDTKQEYYAAIIADATACCAQGIEFVWAGVHSYPQDYFLFACVSGGDLLIVKPFHMFNGRPDFL